MPVTGATAASNFAFDPQIAQSHVAAYFRKLLVITKLATKPPDNKFPKTPGNTLTFPYFEPVGAAADGVENTDVDIDDIGDKSFTAAIKEITKGVGITDTALKKMGCTHADWEKEAHRQIARVLAEKVEDDLWTELKLPASRDALSTNSGNIALTEDFGNDKGALSSEYAKQLCNVRSIAEALTEAFGDRRGECSAAVLHSEHYKNIETDANAGFLKADANDPMYKIRGFVGRAPGLFGLPFFVNDQVPEEADVTITDGSSSTQDYKSYSMVFLKNNAFGLFMKQYPKIEYDRNIRARVDFMVATQWYALKSFHKVISTDDVRIAFKRFSTQKQA